MRDDLVLAEDCNNDLRKELIQMSRLEESNLLLEARVKVFLLQIQIDWFMIQELNDELSRLNELTTTWDKVFF